jgi:predicted dienelactone hydrolase
VQAPLARQSEQVEKFLWIEPVRDFLFTLDQISLAPPDGLESLIDTDHVGVTGYSYGGDISLAVSGARVDPEFYRSQCAQMLASVPEPLRWIYADFICLDYSKWDDFIATVGDEIINSDNGLWQPITDGRIRAVMPMAPTISWYFGERGLAFVDRPTLLIWGTRDFLSPYHLEAGYTFEHINIPDRFLISFIGKTHSMPFSEDSALRIKHFVTAFFGHYLQGQEDYSKYFSKEFVAQFDDLFWGVYSD